MTISIKDRRKNSAKRFTDAIDWPPWAATAYKAINSRSWVDNPRATLTSLLIAGAAIDGGRSRLVCGTTTQLRINLILNSTDGKGDTVSAITNLVNRWNTNVFINLHETNSQPAWIKCFHIKDPGGVVLHLFDESEAAPRDGRSVKSGARILDLKASGPIPMPLLSHSVISDKGMTKKAREELDELLAKKMEVPCFIQVNLSQPESFAANVQASDITGGDAARVLTFFSATYSQSREPLDETPIDRDKGYMKLLSASVDRQGALGSERKRPHIFFCTSEAAKELSKIKKEFANEADRREELDPDDLAITFLKRAIEKIKGIALLSSVMSSRTDTSLHLEDVLFAKSVTILSLNDSLSIYSSAITDEWTRIARKIHTRLKTKGMTVKQIQDITAYRSSKAERKAARLMTELLEWHEHGYLTSSIPPAIKKGKRSPSFDAKAILFIPEGSPFITAPQLFSQINPAAPATEHHGLDEAHLRYITEDFDL